MRSTVFRGLSASSAIPALTITSTGAVPAITALQLGALSPAAQLEAFTQAQVAVLNDDAISWLLDIKGYITLTGGVSGASGIETSGTVVAPSAATKITAGKLAVTITGSVGNDTIYGGLKADSISGSAGNDFIDAGEGNDIIVFTNVGDTINGGDGNDTLEITTPFSASMDSNIINVEFITVNGAAGLVADLTAKTEGFKITATGANSVSITGSAGADSITGSAVGDALLGGSGADTIIGGAGIDTMTGGAESDKFVFTALTDSTDLDTFVGTVTDELVGFVTGTDKISLGKAGALSNGVKQVSTITIAGTVEVNEVATVTGIATANVVVNTGTDATATATALVTGINLAAGATVIATSTAGIVTLTANTAGTGFSAGASVADGTSVTLNVGTSATVATPMPNTPEIGNYIEVLTPVADLTTLLTAADTALNGTIDFYFGVVGLDGYLVTDSDGTGHTDIIKLTAVANIAAEDIMI